jgi:hypothetical protein
MRPYLVVLLLVIGCANGNNGGGGNGDDGGGVGDDDDDGGGDDDGGDDDGGDDAPPDAQPGAPDAHVTPGVCTDGLGGWTGHDDVAPSQDPPCGLSPSQVPQFVSIGFDDNAYSGLEGSNGTGGLSWATQMLGERQNHDGSQVRASFYMTSTYIDIWQSESPTYVKRAWHTAMVDGNDIGNHTKSHSHGSAFDASAWHAEIEPCIESLIKPFDPNEVNFSPDPTKGIGASASDIIGFRTPFLEYDDELFGVLSDLDFHYDCSIEDGFQEDQDGTNYLWPYTLDHGSPGNEVLVEWGSKEPITPHPGLWELPVSPVIVPPELRATMAQRQSWFDVESGKITGFDYNLWVQFSMTKAEFLATLKYTLDQRLAGNRAPFMFGAHSDSYSSKYTAAPASTAAERQQAIEEFLDYATSKAAVRVTSNQEILEWVRNPVPL